MTKGNEIMRLFGRHDSGYPGRREDVTFLSLARQGEVEGGLLHDDSAFRDRGALRCGLSRNVDHIGVPGGGEMRELRHEQPNYPKAGG